MGKRKKVYGTVIEKMIIEEAGAEGKCIGRHDGKIVFVPFAAPGDIADIMLVRAKKNYCEGFLREIHTQSPERVEPKCEHFGDCGGCKWQHLSYKAQVAMKSKHVADNFKKIANLETEMMPVIASDKDYYYRNKLEFSFSDLKWIIKQDENQDKEMRALGFHIPRRFDKILHINECHLQPQYSNTIRNTVYKTALEMNLSFFNRKTQEGLLRNLIIRNNQQGKWMVSLVVKEENDTVFQFLTILKEKLPKVHSWIYIINNKKNDSMDGLKYKVFDGPEFLEEEMEHLKFEVSPLSFYQTNHTQAYELYKKARELAGLSGNEIVYDLYTGTGTIALFIAPFAKKVIGIEYVEAAIANANSNAELNAVENCTFYCGDLAKTLTDDFIAENGQPDVIITDPPRSGMHPDVVQQILKVAPQKIVYVSCNSATQARDIALMKDQYEVSYLQAVDMFPQTHHIEAVALLVNRFHP